MSATKGAQHCSNKIQPVNLCKCKINIPMRLEMNFPSRQDPQTRRLADQHSIPSHTHASLFHCNLTDRRYRIAGRGVNEGCQSKVKFLPPAARRPQAAEHPKFPLFHWACCPLPIMATRGQAAKEASSCPFCASPDNIRSELCRNGKEKYSPNVRRPQRAFGRWAL